MFQMSDHSELRAAQRRLTSEEVEYVMFFGTRFFVHGAKVFYLREKDLPPGDRRGPLIRLVGTAVVSSLDHRQVITVWRNRKRGLKFLRQRAGMHGRPRQGQSSPWETDLLEDDLIIFDPLGQEYADEIAGAEAVALENASLFGQGDAD